MGNIVVSEFMTLDGVIEEPTWSEPFFNDEVAQFKLADLVASDALLLGRRTYEIHAAAWPEMTDEQGFADRMNSLPKYVVSTTLTQLDWNNARLIQGNLPEAIQALKQEVSRNILIDGGSDLVNALMHYDLIDEYRLLMHPIVLGKGKRLFSEGTEKRLNLNESTTFSTGVVALIYQPAQTQD